MLTLFQSHKRASALDRRRRDRGNRHHVNEEEEDCALSQADRPDLEARALAAPPHGDQQQMITAEESTWPPSRQHRRQRYRSRNCQNFRRFGDFFQFTAQSDGNGSLQPCGRRGLRGYDRLQTDELRELQSRVAELERQRDLLQSSMVNSYLNAIGHAMDMVKQFYILFANGYDPVRFPVHGRTTEAFMRAVMEEDVVCTEFKGVDLFLNQYQVSSQAHASLKLALQDIMTITDDTGSDNGNSSTIQIKASATCTLRIKRATLEQLFPAIIADEALTQQLIGKEYVLQYDKVFHFQRGLVFQHESRIDFGNGILAMVGDPFAATKLLEASVMTKHGHFRLDHRIEEDAHTLENTVCNSRRRAGYGTLDDERDDAVEPAREHAKLARAPEQRAVRLQLVGVGEGVRDARAREHAHERAVGGLVAAHDHGAEKDREPDGDRLEVVLHDALPAEVDRARLLDLFGFTIALGVGEPVVLLRELAVLVERVVLRRARTRGEGFAALDRHCREELDEECRGAHGERLHGRRDGDERHAAGEAVDVWGRVGKCALKAAKQARCAGGGYGGCSSCG